MFISTSSSPSSTSSASPHRQARVRADRVLSNFRHRLGRSICPRGYPHEPHRFAHAVVGAFDRGADSLELPTSVTCSFPFPLCTAVELLLFRAGGALDDPSAADDTFALG